MTRVKAYITAAMLAVSLGVLGQSGQAMAKPAPVMTNADVIAMAKAGLGESVIAAKIRHSAVSFDLSTAGLVELSKAGVSSSVMTVMIERMDSSPKSGFVCLTAEQCQKLKLDTGQQNKEAQNCYLTNCRKICEPGCDPPNENGTVTGCSSCYSWYYDCDLVCK